MQTKIAVVLAVLALPACGLVGWTIDRAQCGLKCPSHKSCQVVSSGVFTSQSSCEPKPGWICNRSDQGEWVNDKWVLFPPKTCDCWIADGRTRYSDAEWLSCPKESR